MELVEQILRRYGPMSSGEAVDRLVTDHGLSRVTARQRISRASKEGGNVKRLAYLPLPRNARFIYLPKDYGSPQYWQNLISVLQEQKTAYGLALAAIRLRGGVMPIRHFEIACGAPATPLKKHIQSCTILNTLVTAGLVRRLDLEGLGECVLLDSEGDGSHCVAEIRARLIAENLLIGATKDWIRKLALGSYDRVKTRDEDANALPMVSVFAWDISAPSYIWALTQRKKDQPLKSGFVVADVLLNYQVDLEGIRPFLNKCATLRNLSNVGRCMQIMVAERYTSDALKAAREAGVIPGTPSSLFGQEAAEGLRLLVDVLSNAAIMAVDAEKVDALFTKLSKVEGAKATLQGALFEYICADLIRKTFAHDSLNMNEVYTDPDGKQAEVDITVTTHDSVVFVECKGYAPYREVPDTEVKRWLTTRIPTVRQVALHRSEWRSRKLVFEFWTSGKLSPTATAMLEQAIANTAKYEIRYRDAAELRKTFQQSGGTQLARVFESHFLSNPLSTLENPPPNAVGLQPTQQLPPAIGGLLALPKGAQPDS